MMEIINSNYTARIRAPSLSHIQSCLPNSVLYMHKPFMLKYSLKGVTILIFNSFKVRIMGKSNSHSEIFHEIIARVPNLDIVEDLKLMCHSVISKLPYNSINLHALGSANFNVNIELFPAAQFKHEGKESVNLFSTGKIVIMGVKSL